MLVTYAIVVWSCDMMLCMLCIFILNLDLLFNIIVSVFYFGKNRQNFIANHCKLLIYPNLKHLVYSERKLKDPLVRALMTRPVT
ncbi:hypothetical protein BpHYR1_026164 [Brachionus plicatilis]|uniref:Uncharacterized protein n=1 Tax=Brachionus plicatilis TaxID=10195 RepID=A0A3M7T7D5_BRAPC|nr:hypothetical protein BpHYR1_026164 [Brachionus plicatilis]